MTVGLCMLLARTRLLRCGCFHAMRLEGRKLSDSWKLPSAIKSKLEPLWRHWGPTTTNAGGNRTFSPERHIQGELVRTALTKVRAQVCTPNVDVCHTSRFGHNKARASTIAFCAPVLFITLHPIKRASEYLPLWYALEIRDQAY